MSKYNNTKNHHIVVILFTDYENFIFTSLYTLKITEITENLQYYLYNNFGD